MIMERNHSGISLNLRNEIKQGLSSKRFLFQTRPYVQTQMKVFQLLELFIQNCIKSIKSEKDRLGYLANFNLPHLTENERVLSEGKLTKQECWEALVSMGTIESSGNGGFTKEFYVCFVNELHGYLIESLKEAEK